MSETDEHARDEHDDEELLPPPDVSVELVPERDDADPLQELRAAELASLGDAYHMHAELLDEQRTHTAELTGLAGSLSDAAARLTEAIDRFRSFAEEERAHIEEKRPPIDTTPKRGFGGPGF